MARCGSCCHLCTEQSSCAAGKPVTIASFGFWAVNVLPLVWPSVGFTSVNISHHMHMSALTCTATDCCIQVHMPNSLFHSHQTCNFPLGLGTFMPEQLLALGTMTPPRSSQRSQRQHLAAAAVVHGGRCNAQAAASTS